jgi:hypothetical protein
VKNEKHIKCWSESLKARDNPEDLGVNEIIIDKILGNGVGGCGLDSSGSG